MISSLFKIVFVVVHTVAMSLFAIVCSIAMRRNNSFFDAFMDVYCSVMLKVCGVRLVVQGLENIDLKKNYIYVANHASLFDIPAVTSAVGGKVRFMYKKELGRIPLWGWAMNLTGQHIGVERGHGPSAMKSLDDAVERMKTGTSVLMFAEGTRTPDGNLQDFKRGAFKLALRADVPVVPLSIKGSFGILPKHTFRIHPGTITLEFDKPIVPKHSNGKSSEMELLNEVRQVIEQHVMN